MMRHQVITEERKASVQSTQIHRKKYLSTKTRDKVVINKSFRTYITDWFFTLPDNSVDMFNVFSLNTGKTLKQGRQFPLRAIQLGRSLFIQKRIYPS